MSAIPNIHLMSEKEKIERGISEEIEEEEPKKEKKK